MKRVLSLGAAFLVVCAWTGSSHAYDGITLEIPNMTPGLAVGDTLYVTPITASKVATQYTAAGQYEYVLSNVNSTDAGILGQQTPFVEQSNGNYSGTVYGFCIQLLTDIPVGTPESGFTLTQASTNSSIGPLSVPQLNNVLYLMGEFNAAQPAAHPNGFNKAPTANNELNDALSIAIWEVLNGTGNDSPGQAYNIIAGTGSSATPDMNDITVYFNALSGTFCSADVVNLANMWLTGLTSSGPGSSALPGVALPATDLYVLTTNPNNIQDQTVTIMTSSVNMGGAAPEPKDTRSLASLGLLGLAAGAIVVFRRRRAGALVSGK